MMGLRRVALGGAIILLALDACAPLGMPSGGPRPTIDGALPLAFDSRDGDSIDEAKLLRLGYPPEAAAEYIRNNMVASYITKSEALCVDYLNELTKTERDSNLAFGTLSTLLGGLGGVLVHAAQPLSAAAGIASGERALFESATFPKTADVIAAAIISSRNRTYNDIVQIKFPKTVTAWPPNLALADLQSFHSQCSLHAGLVEAVASINAIPASVPVADSDPSKPAGRASGPKDFVPAAAPVEIQRDVSFVQSRTIRQVLLARLTKFSTKQAVALYGRMFPNFDKRGPKVQLLIQSSVPHPESLDQKDYKAFLLRWLTLDDPAFIAQWRPAIDASEK
jgi:hypothetical protein